MKVAMKKPLVFRLYSLTVAFFEDVETYYLEQDSNIDTLFVKASQRDTGNRCAGFSFDEVAFNGVAATLDDTVEPPVYVLVE